MSIILDALKKAEQTDGDKKPLESTGTGAFGPPMAAKKPKLSKVRIILLVLVVLIGLGAVLVQRLLPTKNAILTKANELKSKMAQSNAKLPTAVVPGGKPANTDGKNADEKIDEEKIAALRKEAVKNFQDGRYDESAQLYAQLIALKSDDAGIFNDYGLLLRKQGQYKDALIAYGKALAIKPEFPEALNNMAVAQMTIGSFADAKKNLKKAIELKPSYVDPYLHMGLCLEKTGESTAAIGYYETFLKMSEGSVDRRIRLQVEGRIARLNEELSAPE